VHDLDKPCDHCDDRNFERALSFVLAHEGGLAEDPNDPGGVTNFGISVRFAGSVQLDVDGDGRTSGEDIRALTREQATKLYFEHFWQPLRCAEMPAGVALIVFDGGVNQGQRAIARLVQRAAGASDDGVIGRKTLRAIRLWDGRYADLVDEIAARRARRYAQTWKFERYGLGWMRRLMGAHGTARSLTA